MKKTDMDFQQVMEFTGFERRLPTEHEIELLVTVSTPAMFDQIAERDKIPLSEQPGRLQKLIEQSRIEWMANSYVLDFKSVGKRLIFHHQIVIALQDHEAIREFFDNAGITPSIMEQTSSVLGEEFKKAVRQSTAPHNHLLVGHYCLLIDADDKVVYKNGYDVDLCLRETQKKEKQATTQENKS